MFLRIVILFFLLQCLCLALPPEPIHHETCLLGYMTDYQQWVDEIGTLTDHVDPERAIDLSSRVNPVPLLQKTLDRNGPKSNKHLQYLSMARCRLNRIPPIFRMLDGGKHLSDTIEYLSFYGNQFIGIDAGGHYDISFNASNSKVDDSWKGQRGLASFVWSSGFEGIRFPNLKELDLRNCSIQVLGEHIFSEMIHLEALYLGGNEICYIYSTAFLGLNHLIYLDLNKNDPVDENSNQKILLTDTYLVFHHLRNLEILDLSDAKLSSNNFGLLMSFGKSLKTLSICRTGLNSLPNGIFKETSLEVLDVSGNNGILTFHRSLEGLENSLKVINAKETGLASMEMFRDFGKLEILALSVNEINTVNPRLLRGLKNLMVLDLYKNRVTPWFEPTFSFSKSLKFLSLIENNINIITEDMINDIKYIDYVAMGGNFMVCNCHVKDFYKKAYKNQQFVNDTLIKKPIAIVQQLAYDVYNQLIESRIPLELDCNKNCLDKIENNGRFRIIDYHNDWYQCLDMPEGRPLEIYEVLGCSQEVRDIEYDQLAGGKRKLLALLTLPCLFLPVAIIFVFRRRIKYFLITMRNSAMFSMVHKNEVLDTDTIFHYDVFVSYCNEDRSWVLNYLLPHIEEECNVSACLHERDFQVGLSILDNIVSCMDRSKSIMLIISQRFLLSHWCQFEMHLAQHRLLETRREDLTLILLEDIPRRLRPNTLHYLMLTKTYIVWPKEESEKQLFWRRLKKTLTSQKSKHLDNNSLA